MGKKETEGYWVIEYKDYENKCYVDCYGFPNSHIEEAMPFETKTKAYKYMMEHDLTKRCIAYRVC